MRRFLLKIPLFLVFLLLGAIFVRVYRVNELLGFYFDQGRDAKVIWDFWHKGDFFLIGPTTGIEGIFRGPWYYWLIAPFYLLGGGDPVFPAVLLALTTVVAIFLLYRLTLEVGGKVSAYLAVIIASFSFFLITASRWLSNPTPMFLISMLLAWSLFLIVDGRRWAWLMLAFLLGMAMQFGSATEVFLFPAVGVFAFWQRAKLPNKKILFYSLVALLITFLPQIVFDLRNNGVLSSAIAKFLFKEGSFELGLKEVVTSRLKFYFDVFFGKLFPADGGYRLPFLLIAGASIVFNIRGILRNEKLVTVLIVFLSPLSGMFFFQGNYGNIYDYYFTGYYFIFVLIFAVALGYSKSHPLGVLLIVLFLFLFLRDNLSIINQYLKTNTNRPDSITLDSQLRAVDWVLQDFGGREKFNVDVYVPPVITHSWDYLFLWQTTKRCEEDRCGLELGENVSLLYTIYEIDPPHPERLEAWLARQSGIGMVEKTQKFGGITVERRTRLSAD